MLICGVSVLNLMTEHHCSWDEAIQIYKENIDRLSFHTITTNVQLPPYRYQRYRRSLDISAMLIACDFTRVEGLGTTRFTQQYCTQQKIPRLDSSGMYSLTHHSLTFEIWSPV